MISTAATLFYGRRSRPIRSFNDLEQDLQFPSSSSSSCSNHRQRNTKTNHHHHHLRRHRHHQTPERSFPPFDPSPLSASEQPRGCIDMSPLQNILIREATHDLGTRPGEIRRLPGSVLLARERLLQRLRGVSASEVRDSGETSASALQNDASSTVLFVGAHQQSQPLELHNRPQGLTTKAISQLPHEVFLESQKAVGNSVSKTTKDCSICLDIFLEGNELIKLHCGHRFHANCLYPWLQSCGECPYCRSSIVTTG